MSGAVTLSRVGRSILTIVALLSIGFLACRALSPKFGADLWFGRPDSWQTVAIVAAVFTVLAVWTYRARNVDRAGGVPVAIIAGLGATSLLLAFSSFWSCYDKQHPKFFTALTFTGALVKGAIGDQATGNPNEPMHVCPIPTPVALDVARLSAQAVLAQTYFSMRTTEAQQRLADAKKKPRLTIESGGGTQAQAADASAEGQPARRNEPKVGRNDPCPCGSGKKFKKCHGA